jgi:hypothetical protein
MKVDLINNVGKMTEEGRKKDHPGPVYNNFTSVMDVLRKKLPKDLQRS